MAPLALALALLTTSCEFSTDEDGGTQAAEIAGAVKKRELPRVRTTPVEEREMINVLETTTVVQSEQQVEVFPKVTGVVLELLCEEGDLVEMDDVLARLDPEEAEIQVADARVAVEEAKAGVQKLALGTQEAEARMNSSRRTSEQAERDHERNEAIATGGPNNTALVSAKDLDASRLARDTASGEFDAARIALQRARVDEQLARTGVDRAELTLKRNKVALGNTEIIAPFSGVLSSRSIEIGATASPAMAAFVLTDPFQLRTVFYRQQRELPLFSAAYRLNGAENGHGGATADLEITARAEALPGRVFRGEIVRVSPTIDPESGAFRVTARLTRTADDGSGALLLPGMLVRLSIVTDRHPEAQVVPKRSIRREGDVTLLFAVNPDSTVRRVEVETGFSTDDDVEVLPLEGQVLEVGDLVVVVGNRDLEEGDEVELESADEDEAEADAPEDELLEELDYIAGESPAVEEASTESQDEGETTPASDEDDS